MAWRCVRIEDRGGAGSSCDICRRKVRHVHVMTNPQEVDPVMAGCRCAGKLEGDPRRARRRERIYAALALKLEVFLQDKSWRRSGAGERFEARDWTVHVHYARGGWLASISHARVCFSETMGPFEETDGLRRAVFDRLLELVADERIEELPLLEPQFNLAGGASE